VINRTALRTAITTGLGNAFASLSGVEFSQYVALAVLAVSTGNLGGAIELGRQRLLGTVLGAGLLLVGHGGLQNLPMPVGLAITLGSLRLLGGLLQLKVGYKVGGMIIVMGWLVHEGNLASWLPIRFFWTAFGVLLTLLSLRLFWPARGLDLCLTAYANLLAQLQESFHHLADALQPEPAAPTGAARARMLDQGAYRSLRNQLLAMRSLRPALLQELGSIPERHPANLLLNNFDNTASHLITLVGGLQRAKPSPLDSPLVSQLHRAEGEFLRAMADHLEQWERQIRRHKGLPKPPAVTLEVPQSWLELSPKLNDPMANSASLERLERIATRLVLCRQAERAIRDGEANWMAILSRA
jgi:hypothetical protein